MKYCKKCLYPANAKPAIFFDDSGVCSGCRSFEIRTSERNKIDWLARKAALIELLAEYSKRQRKKGNPYDCIIPVSGGKDSTYQVWFVRSQLGFNPLLVSYNHSFNTSLGIRNLSNLVEKLDCNLVRFTTAPGSAIRLAKYMLGKVGDITWHYHAGIMTYPVQAAIQYDVPLIVWGEEGFSELVGMHNFDDQVEFTKKKRQEHSMRGIEPEDLLADQKCPLTRYDLAPFFYPSDAEIDRVGVRGIYLSNYIPWDARTQTEFVIKELGFASTTSRDRTFNIYAKTDCLYANGLHDYLKYLKFGYGRATDDASNEIRHGRMTRREGIDLVMQYDHRVPVDLDWFMKTAGVTGDDIAAAVDPLRDPGMWELRAGKPGTASAQWLKLYEVWDSDPEPETDKRWSPFKPTPNAMPIEPGGIL